MILDDLLKNGAKEAVYVLARYCYRMGLPTISDDDYDQLESWIRQERGDVFAEYLNRSYDDDPMPEKLLEATGIEKIYPPVPNDLYKYLEEEKSNSIRAVRSYEEAFSFFKAAVGKTIIASLKLDGVNSKMLYSNKNFVLCLSRGRKGNSIDYTTGARYVMPRTINHDGLIKITGECFVDKNQLNNIREKYDKEKYKTCKSAAISMLRVEHKREDYEHLLLKAFSCEGLDHNTVSEGYKWLESVGFDTPPWITITEWPQEFGDFCEWLNRTIMDPLSYYGKDFPSDGVVVELNDLSEPGERQIALKFGKWGFEEMKGIITDIIIEQKRVYKSVRIRIDPIVSSDGCSAEYINSFNPSILVENDLYKGQEVYFERNSGAVNILIHGKRLGEIKNGEKEDIQ